MNGWSSERYKLLIDKKQYQEAKDLLLSTHFQKVHQTYTRTDFGNRSTKAWASPRNLYRNNSARIA